MKKLTDKKARQVFRWMAWEKTRLHPDYRSDIYRMKEQISSGKLDDVAQVLDLLYEFGYKWKISHPIDPETEWEAIEDKAESLFFDYAQNLLGFPAIRKPLESLFGKTFLSPGFSPPTRLPDKWHGKDSRLSTKWEISFRAYYLCQIKRKTEKEAATIIKVETKGKVDLTVDAVHKAKKRVYELIFNEPYTTKRGRLKKYAGEPGPCRSCEDEPCTATGKPCELLEEWLDRVEPLMAEEARQDEIIRKADKSGNSELTQSDLSKAEREMRAYLAYPTCVFENPETGDSFAYHSPEAVRVFFHVPKLRLNSVFISKRLGFFYDPEC